MRVLFFTQYFAPEVGATQGRTHDMARALVRAGHRVTLICEVPNHPGGRIWPLYRGKPFARERLDGIDVLRVWVKASPEKSFGGRLSFYASYMAMATLAGLILARGHYDLVFATSPPLLVGGAGLTVAALRRLPFVFEVRDPWPAAAVALGELREGPALRLAQWLEQLCYRHAATAITVTEGWRRHLLEQGVPDDRIALIPNGANTALFHPQPEAGADMRRQLGIDAQTFVLVYAGLHGIAQGLDALLQCAVLLREVDSVRIVLAGDGPEKATLMQCAERMGLANVQFVDAVPRQQAAALFCMADAALVPLRRHALFHGTLPAKAYDAWACGVPLLASADGELRQLIESYDAGICVAPEDPQGLAEAIRGMQGTPDRNRTMGENGLRLVRSRFNREDQARLFVKTLEEAARN